MFSLLSCDAGCSELCASINCERRRAQAMPAGPPPTITTSAGICGRSTPSIGLRKTSIKSVALCFLSVPSCPLWLKFLREPLSSSFHFLHFLNQRRHDIEQVPDNRVIRNLEDRRL